MESDTDSRTVAVFGPNSGAAFSGRSLVVREGQFSIEGIGDLAASQVAQYERDGLLIWSDRTVRDELVQPATGDVTATAEPAPTGDVTATAEPAKGGGGFPVRLVVIAVIVLVAAAAAVYLYQTYAKSDVAGVHTISGTLSAPDKDYDIDYASVEARDESGDIVGTTTSSGYEKTELGEVQVTFSVDVPKRDFYSVTVGTHEGPSYSFAELEANEWHLDLTLGD